MWSAFMAVMELALKFEGRQNMILSVTNMRGFVSVSYMQFINLLH